MTLTPKTGQKEKVYSPQKIGRYAISGVLSGASMVTVSLLFHRAGFTKPVSTAIGVSVSFLVSFYLQKVWVFKSKNKSSSSLFKFSIVTLTTWTLSIGVYNILDSALKLPFILTQLSMVGFIAASNLFLNSIWTFRD